MRVHTIDYTRSDVIHSVRQESGSVSGDDDHPSRPIPPRYYWLKRITLGLLIMFIILCGLRWWLGVVVDRRLQAEIDLIKARGDPLFLEDFATEPIADEDNAVKALLEAEALMDDTNYGDARQYFADNAKARAMIRKARSRPRCSWRDQLTLPVILYATLMATRRMEVDVIELLIYPNGPIARCSEILAYGKGEVSGVRTPRVPTPELSPYTNTT